MRPTITDSSTGARKQHEHAIRNMAFGTALAGATAVANLMFPVVISSNIALALSVAAISAGGAIFLKGFFALPGYYDLKAVCESQKPHQL